MPRISVLGCGRIGRMHADNIAAHPQATLAGVFDTHAPFAAEIAEKHGVTNFASAEEAINSDNVDAILIATPTSTHVEFLEACVKAGKAVLCEKPIDLSLERVNALAKRIEGTKVPIMLGFVRRFDPGHAAAERALAAGEIGELHQVTITSRDPGMAPDGYIKTSGGIFRDMTIHDLDLARFLLGEEVTEVTAAGSRLVNPALMDECNDYDTVVVILKSVSGKQAVITNSREAVYGYDQRIELLGSKGMLVTDNHHNHAMKKYLATETNVSSPLQHFFIERYGEAFDIEISKFVDAIENGAPVPVGFEDGRLALLLAEACFKSVAEKRTVLTSEFA
jgi:myo-inositol 2-dehydrogenase / D-chiro-inositol 1-dehydrogenase